MLDSQSQLSDPAQRTREELSSTMLGSLRLVSMKNRLFLKRGGPDVLTEELVNAFSGQASFEYKALFSVVYASLRARNAAHGGEEMLRLRIYDKLQHLVQVGGVNKCEKVYRGNPEILETITEQLAAQHCRELLAVVKSPVPQS